MGYPSISIHRGLVHWQGLLLIASLLTFWSPPTTAKIYIDWIIAMEGHEVLLEMHNKPPEATGIVWYKGETLDHNNIIAFLMKTPDFYLTGPGRTGHEMITDDGFLLLKNVTKKDEGKYTVVVHLPDSKTDTGFAMLEVYGIRGSGENQGCPSTSETSP